MADINTVINVFQMPGKIAYTCWNHVAQLRSYTATPQRTVHQLSQVNNFRTYLCFTTVNNIQNLFLVVYTQRISAYSKINQSRTSQVFHNSKQIIASQIYIVKEPHTMVKFECPVFNTMWKETSWSYSNQLQWLTQWDRHVWTVGRRC